MLLCAVEVSFLRLILSGVRAAALIGYQRKKAEWGEITRRAIKFD